MERKVFPALVTKVNAEQGIVEHIVAVMGVRDLGYDIIYPGAFTKTLAERGRKVRCLDQHQTDSIMRVLGKPLELRELKRAELPPELLAKHPEATGGLFVKTQFLLDTPEGRGAFVRIKEGAVDEWSFGYDPVPGATSVSKVGGAVTRHLKEVVLWEYSPVLWGMNPATTTISAKAAGAAKPYGARHEDDGQWRVYKLDGEGEPTGAALGAHGTEEEANAQVAALYANEGKSVNLTNVVRKIETAFESSYNVPGSPIEYWVREVYDDYCVITCWGRGPSAYYRVNYTVGEDGTVVFAPHAEWLPGEYVFVADEPGAAGMVSITSQTASKAGRVQAARNLARLQQIAKLLNELMQDAGANNSAEEDTADNAGANGKDEATGADNGKGNGGGNKGAGSGGRQPTSSTPDNNSELLMLIAVEQQLARLET